MWLLMSERRWRCTRGRVATATAAPHPRRLRRTHTASSQLRKGEPAATPARSAAHPARLVVHALASALVPSPQPHPPRGAASAPCSSKHAAASPLAPGPRSHLLSQPPPLPPPDPRPRLPQQPAAGTAPALRLSLARRQPLVPAATLMCDRCGVHVGVPARMRWRWRWRLPPPPPPVPLPVLHSAHRTRTPSPPATPMPQLHGHGRSRKQGQGQLPVWWLWGEAC